MYEIEIRHEGLNKYRHIRGLDRYIAEQKAAAQIAAWDEQWAKKLEVEARKAARQRAAEEKQAKKDLADERTIEAQEILKSLENTLAHALKIDDAINWETLKYKHEFAEKKQITPKKYLPDEPVRSSFKYKPKYSFLHYLVPGLVGRIKRNAENHYFEDRTNWKNDVEKIEKKFELQMKAYEASLLDWENKKANFEKIREEQNAAVDEQELRYRAKEPTAIEEYCDLVLSNSQYPDFMPQEYELEYKAEAELLVVEYRIPSLDDLPTLNQIKYIQSRDTFEEVHLKEAALNRLYDSLIYQICLRTIHEIFEADVVEAITSVAFNGWVNYVDRGTGRDTRACILSLQANRESFLEIDLSRVDPKACFKAMKGVGSSQLNRMAPVAPIVRISREDARFVQSVEVADKLEAGTNLAAIDWKDFEHLIREVFEKEFSKSGGEVKVTQASRDGGVDAVAFDPDPIRGGKIVIQAKRYTNVVGVAAVRDLYGTVMNEGATKGILVTTSSYGPDAFEFAKGKPLTLLDGGNLLHLLGEHGHKARIDLAEAKLLAEEK